MEEFYHHIKDCLREYNYPSIENLKNDCEIRRILDSQNRSNLIVWVLENMNFILDDSDKTLDGLADLIASLGMCTPDEALYFMEGKLKPTKRQFFILYEIIMMLNSSNNITSSEFETDVTEEEPEEVFIPKRMHINEINLFPTYGPIARFSEEEQIARRQELNTKLEIVQNQESSLEKLDDNEYILEVVGSNIEIGKADLSEFKIVVESLTNLENKITKCKLFQDTQDISKDVIIVCQYKMNCWKIHHFLTQYEEAQEEKEDEWEYESNQILIFNDLIEMLKDLNYNYPPDLF